MLEIRVSVILRVGDLTLCQGAGTQKASKSHFVR